MNHKVRTTGSDRIFVGRDGIGFVWFIETGDLASSHSIGHPVSVKHNGQEWISCEPRDVPDAVWDIAERELNRRRDDYLGQSRRRCRTNPSYVAARNDGVEVTILTSGDQYLCRVRWLCADENASRVEAEFDSLDSARKWAENRCCTSPSFGDPVWC